MILSNQTRLKTWPNNILLDWKSNFIFFKVSLSTWLRIWWNTLILDIKNYVTWPEQIQIKQIDTPNAKKPFSLPIFLQSRSSFSRRLTRKSLNCMQISSYSTGKETSVCNVQYPPGASSSSICIARYSRKLSKTRIRPRGISMPATVT